jgi:hypothetical protein
MTAGGMAALAAGVALLSWNAAVADTPNATTRRNDPTVTQTPPAPATTADARGKPLTPPTPADVTMTPTPAASAVLTDVRVYPSF